VHFALDAAATSFWNEGRYAVGGELLSSEELHALYASLSSRFPIFSIEDPFEEHALADTASLQRDINAVRLVGDDLTVTSAARIMKATEAGAIRAVIIKPNQAGTLSETLDAIRAARRAGIDCIVSHRSGETMDTFISDLAVAIGAFGLKAGALRRAERRVKYERLAELLA
jgi:enolase